MADLAEDVGYWGRSGQAAANLLDGRKLFWITDFRSTTPAT
jgi:hypothetical protein